MTIWQVLALLFGAPILLWNFAVLGSIFINKKGSWGPFNAIFMALAALAIVLSFVGIKW